MKTDKFSIKSRFGSFKFAFRGLASLLKNEHNSRIHLIAAIVVVTAGIILRINLLEWCLLFIVIGLVFLTELLNTSLEVLGDVFDPERNDRIKEVKDYAAGAVLISAIISVITGGFIFLPKLIRLF
jgi:diacylglycerol kinase (ATP)